MVMSAVSSVSTPGVLVTVMPRASAAVTSMLSTPLPKLAISRSCSPAWVRTAASMGSVTVGTSTSAVFTASISSARLIGLSSSLRRVSNNSRIRVSTWSGSLRVTMTSGLRRLAIHMPLARSRQVFPALSWRSRATFNTSVRHGNPATKIPVSAARMPDRPVQPSLTLIADTAAIVTSISVRLSRSSTGAVGSVATILLERGLRSFSIRWPDQDKAFVNEVRCRRGRSREPGANRIDVIDQRTRREIGLAADDRVSSWRSPGFAARRSARATPTRAAGCRCRGSSASNPTM